MNECLLWWFYKDNNRHASMQTHYNTHTHTLTQIIPHPPTLKRCFCVSTNTGSSCEAGPKFEVRGTFFMNSFVGCGWGGAFSSIFMLKTMIHVRNIILCMCAVLCLFIFLPRHRLCSQRIAAQLRQDCHRTCAYFCCHVAAPNPMKWNAHTETCTQGCGACLCVSDKEIDAFCNIFFIYL